jgi:uncharacterized damage-inducible protein DinB
LCGELHHEDGLSLINQVAPTMSELIRPVAESLRISDFFMELMTGDLANDLAVRRVRDTEGPSISWVVGHLLNGRCELLKLLDPEAENPYAERFDRLVVATDGSDYPDIADLRASWHELSGRVFAALESVTDQELVAPIEEVGAPHAEKNLLGLLVYVVWHETYHMGQIGTMRTRLRLKPTIDRAIEVLSPDNDAGTGGNRVSR